MPPAPSKHRLPHQQQSHRPKHRPKLIERRGTARERGYTAEWEAFRSARLAAQPLCEYCLADGLVVAANVLDHDLPHQGDPDLFWNNTFTSLCKRHHDTEKQRAEARLSGDDLLAWVKQRKGEA